MSLRPAAILPPPRPQNPPCCNHHPWHNRCQPSCYIHGCQYCPQYCPPPQWPIPPLPYLPTPGQRAPQMLQAAPTRPLFTETPGQRLPQGAPAPPRSAQPGATAGQRLPQRAPSPPRSAEPAAAAGQQQQLVHSAQQSPVPLMSIQLPPSFYKSSH